jgi:hypothetical protein
MDSITNELMIKADEWSLVLMMLACFRIYLEVIGFNFSELPLTKSFSNRVGTKGMEGFHRFGLYVSIGYVILFSPGILLS